MTELLEKAIDAVRRMPPKAQNAVAEAMLSLVSTDAPDVVVTEDIEPEHLAAVMEGLAQAERGDFATAAEVADAFRRFGR